MYYLSSNLKLLGAAPTGTDSYQPVSSGAVTIFMQSAMEKHVFLLSGFRASYTSTDTVPGEHQFRKFEAVVESTTPSTQNDYHMAYDVSLGLYDNDGDHNLGSGAVGVAMIAVEK